METNILVIIRKNSMAHFGNMTYRAVVGSTQFRRYYVEPRCIVSHNGTNNNPYIGSFCKQKDCIHPLRQCKDCSLCIHF